MATEAVGDDVLEAITGALEALAVAAGLAAGELPFSQGAQVLLEAGQAVGAQRGSAVVGRAGVRPGCGRVERGGKIGDRLERPGPSSLRIWRPHGWSRHSRFSDHGHR